MKNNKLIILIVVGILLITGVTIFTLTRNNVAATKNTCTSGHTYVTGTSYKDLGDGTHKKTCTECEYSTTEAHFDYGKDGIANSGANGICDKCGAKMNAEEACTHTPGLGIYRKDGYHYNICNLCNEPIESTKTKCTPVYRDGKCEITENAHELICAGCEGKSQESHTYTNGKCTTCGKEKTGTGTSNGDCSVNGHNWDYTSCIGYQGHNAICTKCEKYKYYEWQYHKFENHKCTECGYTCDHKSGNDISWTYISENGCAQKCNNCDYVGTTKAHSLKCKAFTKDFHTYRCENCGEAGYTHNNIVKEQKAASCKAEGYTIYGCNSCDFEAKFTTRKTDHTPVIDKAVPATCTTPGKTEGSHCSVCGTVIVAQTTIPATGHKDGNNDGKCDTCGYVMSTPHTHTPKKTYESDNTYHWKICSDTTCNQVIGAKEVHIDNNKDGKCDVCAYTMSTVDEECTHPITERKLCNNETEHWFECEKCGEEIDGTREKHKYENGKCACGIECKHKNTTPKSDDTYHWDECDTCGEKINKKEHSYKDGECECGKKEDKKDEEECKHANKEWKHDEDEHWQVCKECGKEIDGTRKTHTYENGKCACGKECKHKNTAPKSDDTYHWEECKDCGEKLNKKEHSYKDGECECGKKEDKKDEEECKHENKEWKADKDEHWQVCKDCGKEIEGTRGKHVNSDGKCKNCGLKDGSTSGTVLPNTGREENMQIAVMITAAILGAALLIKLSREE